jgi:hypothetical protein
MQKNCEKNCEKNCKKIAATLATLATLTPKHLGFDIV